MKATKHLICLVLFLLIGCSSSEQTASAPKLVKTVIVGGSEAGVERSFPGRVIAGQRADMSFQVAGTLSELPAKEGQQVTQGQLLAKLNASDYENRYTAAKSTRDIAEANYDRGSKLVVNGTISQVTFEDLRNKFEVAKSNEAIAKKAFEDTQLIAPFTGMIARVFVDNFQEVQAKEKILTIQDIQDIDITIDVPERDILKRLNAMEEQTNNQQTLKNAYVVFDGIPGQQFQVYVKEFATEADPTTQTYRVRLSMKTPTNVNILPGMTATLKIKQPAQNMEEINLPANAVAVDAQGHFYVWVVKEDMTVKKTPVQVGDMVGNDIHIQSGVSQGQRVVVAGVPYLTEGMKVRLYTSQY